MQHIQEHNDEQTNELTNVNNHVTLSGVIQSLPNTNGELTLSVARLSGMADNIPIVLGEEIRDRQFAVGEALSLKGQFRSHNEIVGDRSKLMLYVFAQEVIDEPGQFDNPNFIELAGFICKAPTYRTTPFNREIADLLIAVNRACNKSDYIPAIAWGRNARFAKNLLIGEKIHLCGRIQSRQYQKRLDDGNIETRTAYEISINSVERAE